ncbi:hypothetical protein KPH14_005680 [Odynerus spinipes]|uniref:Tetraspanin n=1 Tax=Odynerus spinipes TaxID=1348599 RepID=A0AAD9VJT1_9HYME|nr:hypothetical protein KPH14_005680 [Odynerus spinipes]
MWKKDQIKLLLPQRRYSCLDTVIVSLFFAVLITIIAVGIELLVVSIGIKLHALMELRLLEPYLSTDSNVLLCVSILVITSSSLGLISAIQFSYTGLIASIALLLSLLCITDIYAISNYKVKNYIPPEDLYLLLYNAIENDPLDVALHFMQSTISCCGITDYTDWTYRIGFIPGSCCKNSTICYNDDPSLNKNGCLKNLIIILSNIYQNSVDAIVVLNVVGVIAICMGYFYSYLLRQLKKGEKIFRTVIPRIQASRNFGRSQQTGQTSNSCNNRPNVHVISNHASSSGPTSMYPNLFGSEPAPDL